MMTRRVGLMASVMALVAVGLTGCDGFFVRTSTTTGTTGSTNDYVYVSNSASGTTTINGYNLSSGSFVATTSSPYALNFVPVSMATSIPGTFLYVATNANVNASYSGIYAYTIGTGGALTSVNSGSALVANSPAWIDVSADGQWLVSLDGALNLVYLYGINTSTGALTLQQTVAYTTATGLVTPSKIRFAPSGKWIVAALGTAGDLVIPFTTSSGAMGTPSLITTGSTTVGDYAVAIDSNDYLYVARTGQIAVYSLDATSPTAQVSTIAVGAGPRSIIVDTGNKYVYSANQTDSTISEETIGSAGSLSIIASAVAAPTTVNQLVRDNSGKYVIAAGYGATGLQLESIGSNGALSSVGTAATGSATTVPTVVAATH